MAQRTAQQQPESKGECDNHAGVEAEYVSDGVAHEVIRLCKDCVNRLKRAQGVRRGGQRG